MNLLDQETILELFRAYYPYFVFSLFLGAFALTYYMIPKVLWVSNAKQLMASVNERSSHSVAVPTFGGVAFYLTFILILSVIQSLRLGYVGNHLIAGISILFMVGLKDDLVISTARVKLFGQLAAACFIVFSPELQLTNLYGFWGIYGIPAFIGYGLIALLIVALINAYNLIDGIDGLAAITGIVIAAVYGAIFYITGLPYYVLVCVSLAGILTAFLPFNFSRGRRKIFMGDSGSLVIGFILAFLTIKILVMEPEVSLFAQNYLPANRLLFIATVLFVPVFDTLRVMILRLVKRQSPFTADRNHAHHVLLDLGFSHPKASLCLATLNILVISIYVAFSNFMSHMWLSFLVVSLYAGSFLVFFLLKGKAALVARSGHRTQHFRDVA
ncbi:MraY family glycosyltransferase [Autumnicola musiva]|uniref:MraY family glycosyltransferase n=1 Tax=Autumnicola musiva TaxID=3075589 RepID=A0ABU3D829_9FLAO|nr:MraY family glycosyltransferase [Zunongwangia sp. F117]MDT0677681.1 MraY family glycosyltransferase [Zunongwangia sp. F117]